MSKHDQVPVKGSHSLYLWVDPHLNRTQADSAPNSKFCSGLNGWDFTDPAEELACNGFSL
jgi:hypothetical protein